MRGRVSFIAALASIVMLLGVEGAHACSCIPVPFGKHLKRADGAFNLRLLSVSPAEGTTEAAFRYRVGVVVKGPFRRGRVVTVWSQSSDAVCGLTQGIGDLYGLFVSRDGERWASGACATISPKTMRRRAARGDDASRSASCST